MPSAKLCASGNPVIMSWLARELEKEIPDLDLYGSERRLLDFACKDLESWMKVKWRDLKSDEIEKVLNTEDRQEEIREFLKIWTKQWLEKWRERVTLCQKIPRFSLRYLKTKSKAKKIFKRMEKGQELKKLVVQRLINEGEVCMAELIAENLIIEEIAYRLNMNGGKTPTDKVAFEPWHILQKVLPQVKMLTERKMPLIHLKLMMDV
jgi:RNA polymerase-interacting CarD/CdnL/TRCF family regulator